MLLTFSVLFSHKCCYPIQSGPACGQDSYSRLLIYLFFVSVSTFSRIHQLRHFILVIVSVLFQRPSTSQRSVLNVAGDISVERTHLWQATPLSRANLYTARQIFVWVWRASQSASQPVHLPRHVQRHAGRAPAEDGVPHQLQGRQQGRQQARYQRGRRAGEDMSDEFWWPLITLKFVWEPVKIGMFWWIIASNWWTF